MVFAAFSGVGINHSDCSEMLTLHTTSLSANGRKAISVARHLELDIIVHQVNVYNGEGDNPHYRSLNPWGKIPTLVDGELVIWESNAIILYLSEQYGGNRLYATQPNERANINKWLFWESSHWQPVLVRVLAARVSQVLFESGDELIESHWRDTELVMMLEYLEVLLGKSPYLAGESLSLADFSVAAMTTYFRVCNFPADSYPAIQAWMDRLDGFTSWVSTRNPTYFSDSRK